MFNQVKKSISLSNHTVYYHYITYIYHKLLSFPFKTSMYLHAPSHHDPCSLVNTSKPPWKLTNKHRQCICQPGKWNLCWRLYGLIVQETQVTVICHKSERASSLTAVSTCHCQPSEPINAQNNTVMRVQAKSVTSWGLHGLYFTRFMLRLGEKSKRTGGPGLIYVLSFSSSQTDTVTSCRKQWDLTWKKYAATNKAWCWARSTTAGIWHSGAHAVDLIT